MPLIYYLIVALILFGIGIYGLSVKRNAMRLLFSIEMLMNGANLNVLAFARYLYVPGIQGQPIILFSITIAAVEAAVALAIVIVVSRTCETVDFHELKRLKG
ncbi:MAG: NADH-quinone oxidoreductase subunit NuoK, partial [Candidatus Lokiarchaeota archaeon]|nr:NADH-quinone oxidoreductase subunit NuoK [Candidatus Lokiarchaeota archaeon]